MKAKVNGVTHRTSRHLPAAADLPATLKAALPALTVMLVNGAMDILIAMLILVAGWIVGALGGALGA